MFDAKIARIIRATKEDDDRIPYVCSNPSCGKTTYAPRGCTAVYCGHGAQMDLGTAMALNRWATVVEIHLVNKPETTPAPKRGLMHPKDVLALAIVALTLLVVFA
jgi:hypothetical protein